VSSVVKAFSGNATVGRVTFHQPDNFSNPDSYRQKVRCKKIPFHHRGHRGTQRKPLL